MEKSPGRPLEIFCGSQLNETWDGDWGSYPWYCKLSRAWGGGCALYVIGELKEKVMEWVQRGE